MTKKKQIIIGFILAFLIILALGIYKFLQISAAIEQGKKRGPPPTVITTTVTKLTDWQEVRETIGQVNAIQGAVLSAEASGRVAEVLVKDGARVKKGEILIRLDDSVEKSSYQAAKTQADLNYKAFKRRKALYERKAISTNEFEKAELNYKSSNLEAQSLKASWSRKLIKAPFSGTAGVRRVNVGQYIKEGDPIIPLHDLSSLYIEFDISDSDGKTLKVGDKIQVIGTDLDLKISAIDAAATGLAKTYKARTNNFDSKKFKPGEFARLTFGVSKNTKRIVIPTTAINKAPYGDSVFVIKDGVANPSFVKVLSSRGDFSALENGLEKGDEIATSGIFKIIPGGKVIINNENKTIPQLNPQPSNS